jgi:ElaB/YqjD/DUF883 family membrane-anchored ribosome-binding protein
MIDNNKLFKDIKMIKELRSNNKQLQEALKRRDDLLKEKPELEEFQKDIESILTKSGKNVKNREAALRGLIRTTLTRLAENNKEIQELASKITLE